MPPLARALVAGGIRCSSDPAHPGGARLHAPSPPKRRALLGAGTVLSAADLDAAAKAGAGLRDQSDARRRLPQAARTRRFPCWR